MRQGQIFDLEKNFILGKSKWSIAWLWIWEEFPANFVYDFATKMFLILYSIYLTNFIVSLPLLLEILDNICIAIVC